MLESSHEIITGSNNQENFYEKLAENICKYSFSINAKSIKTDGIENIMSQKNFTMPDCILVRKLLEKNDIKNLTAFSQKLYKFLMNDNQIFNNIYQTDEEEEESSNKNFQEIIFYMSNFL